MFVFIYGSVYGLIALFFVFFWFFFVCFWFCFVFFSSSFSKYECVGFLCVSSVKFYFYHLSLGFISPFFFLVYMSDSFSSSSSFSFSPVLCGLSSLGATARDQASNAKIGDPSSGCWTNRELQPHGTVIGEKILKGLHFNNKTWPHPKASKLQCQIPHAKQLAKEKHNTTR